MLRVMETTFLKQAQFDVEHGFFDLHEQEE